MRNRYIAPMEVSGLFRSASVTVLPYTQASQSGVGLQSIAQGVPVVVTAVGSLPELTDAPNHIVAPGDPAALATALIGALKQNQSDRWRVLEFARAKFDWTNVAKAYGRLYAEVVETHSSSASHSRERIAPSDA